VGIQNGANALVKAGSMIVKINFSRKSLVIAAGGQALVTFLIQFVILGLVYFYYGITPHPTILLVPVLVIPLFLFTLGLSFLLSILNGIMRDIGAMLSFFLTFVMFLTPVLYVKPSAGVLSVMSRYNPLFYLISVPRDFVLYGRTGDWGGFAIAGLAGVLVFFACLIVFHLTETRITERV
jgi:ABC-type polysaccharide/polyol phosphate export systems, permease component